MYDGRKQIRSPFTRRKKRKLEIKLEKKISW